LVNIPAVGIRPQITDDTKTGGCLPICPGAAISTPVPSTEQAHRDDPELGLTLEIWAGYAADPQIRFSGSSGGILTALSLYCLEREAMNFVLHTGKNQESPWLNATVTSSSRAELLSRAGSRYAPSSPCERLDLIENSPASCVFIGKPCDVAAVAALRKQRPGLDRNLGLVLTFFCAGTPSTRGTLNIAGLSPESEGIVDVSYRGHGWPGDFRLAWDNGKQEVRLPYIEAWKRLTAYRPLRCNLCPDGLGRLADISCGDAWDQYDAADPNPGLSLVIVRTPRGRAILHRAMEAGYVHLTPAPRKRILVAQKSLLDRRRELFGRLLSLRLLGIPVPRFTGFNLARSWIKLPLGRKCKTIAGTLRRALQRGWWRRTCRGHIEDPARARHNEGVHLPT
jgi:coenzyme F420 hydrogenase subunit beta